MAEFPALPLFTDAFLGDTIHLDAEETGAYLMLLIVSWRTADCTLPDDDVRLARWARCSPKIWKRIRPTLEPFFTISDSRWEQKRLKDERRYVEGKRDAAAANGRASALKRKGRHSTERPTDDDASDQRSDQQTGQRIVNEQPTPTPTPLFLEPKGSPPSDDEDALRPEHFVEAWNNLAKKLGKPTIRDLTPERRQLLKARINGHSVENFKEVLGNIERSPFLSGEKGTFCTFDWVLKKANFQKILEGNYNRG